MKNLIHTNKKSLIIAIFIAVFIAFPLFAKAESSLDVTCYPNTMTASTGETVTWRASAFGGNGDYYITWRGTNGLSGYGSNLDTEYSSSGVKSASVTVTSGGRSISKNCNSVQIYGSDINNNNNNNYNYNNYDYNNNYNSNYNYNNYDYNNNYNSNYNYNYNNNYNIPLTVSCSVNTPFAPIGTRVSWVALPSGGNGNYSFSWSGNDSVYGYNRTLDIFYNSPGVKNATVTVRSGNQSISRVCSNSITIGAPINPYYNNQYQNTYPTYNPPVVTTPVVSAPKTIIKYVEVPAKKTATTEVTKKVTEKKTNSQVASLSTYADVPWGWVAVMVIIVLLSMIMYLVFNSKKI